MSDSRRPEEKSRRDFLRATGASTAMVLSGGLLPLQAGDDKSPLPARELGKTGVKVPILGTGTATAGSLTRKEATDFFSFCLDIGANYMDTAPQFAGYGLAQKALGDVLKTRRKEAFVVTKCWEPDGEKALKLLKANLKELQTDHADVVYAHSIGADQMDPQKVLGRNGVMKALEKAQRDGLTRFIGISSHNRPERCLKVLKEYEIQVMMTAVSFVSRHIYNFEETVWPEAHRQGVALVAMKVYGGGVSQARIKTEDMFDAYRYAQSLPDVSCVVVGMRNQKELAENLRFVQNYKPLTTAEKEKLLDKGKQLAKSWGEVYGPVV